MDTDVDISHATEAIEAKSSVQCASARQGDIVILVGADLLAGTTIERFVTLCNETLTWTPGTDSSPTPPELLKKLAHRIAKQAHPNCDGGREELPVPGSVVVAEVVEWIAEDSGSSSSTTPEKVDAPTSRAISRMEARDVTPVLEGLEDMKTVRCAMGFGHYSMEFCGDVPKVDMPKWPLQRTLTNDLMCDHEI